MDSFGDGLFWIAIAAVIITYMLIDGHVIGGC